ncbi:FKBP-type peptidyl-prolyl cis-trans isomerase [Pedobacter rhodius]|uniref:peptidylprolyl isomerase n=1 Tax=Pedobacter rhodius TaxID=3004098 RepID=A0ABT4L1T9_9SPHI|nr:FKBP-type peptidyl-prolyl cis-trans isomerase [Pedobacter sp. SJ11]MCZ4225156.1 FKBP-type peptidyl-prolyl cis-trans isomerase [Pedobacter sp. SJ11]
MKKGIIILFAATLGLAACNNYKKGEGDLQYKILKDEGKEKIKEGDFVKLNGIQTVEGTTNADSTLVNTYDNERPAFFPISKSMFKGDLVAALKMLGEGDSASFKLNLDSMAKYSGQPKPAGLKSNYATFTVKIEKVLHKAANEADSTFETKKRTFFETEYKALIAKNKANEAAKIKKYIDDNKLEVKSTASGLQYVIEKPGNAERAALTDTVMVDYTGQFTNKKGNGKINVFDTSNEKIAKEAGIHSPMAQYTARPLVLNQLAPGFIEGVQLIGVGGKIKIIIPSKLGYGENGGGPINPFTPLVFDIEIKSIKKGSAAPVAAQPMPTTPAQ